MHKTLEEQELERRLHADVERLRATAQAEADWAQAFPDHANPWSGAGERLRAAEDALETHKEHERLHLFRAVVEQYENVVSEIRSHAGTPEMLRAIEAEQRGLNAIDLLRRGVHLRAGPLVSEQDAKEREDVARWRELEAKRCWLASEQEQVHGRRSRMECEFPWLREYGKLLDSKVPAAA